MEQPLYVVVPGHFYGKCSKLPAPKFMGRRDEVRGVRDGQTDMQDMARPRLGDYSELLSTLSSGSAGRSEGLQLQEEEMCVLPWKLELEIQVDGGWERFSPPAEEHHGIPAATSFPLSNPPPSLPRGTKWLKTSQASTQLVQLCQVPWDQQRTENTEDFPPLDPTVVAGIFALVASIISVQYIPLVQHAHTNLPALSDAQDLAQGI